MSRAYITLIFLALSLVLGSCARGNKDTAQEEAMPGTVFRKDAALTISSAEQIQRGEFEVEIASTPSATAQGLMYRESMEPHRGMLFDPGDYSNTSFWMKNTYIPLDILFIDAAGKITHIAPDTHPFSEERVDSKGTYRYVLELNAGTCQKLNIAIGDIVTWTKSK